MIKVSVMYPNREGARFDMEYYVSRHMKMVKEKLGPACKGASAELGIAAGEPGSKPQFIALGHLLFETVEAFQQAFGPHAKEILADIPNYTDTQPVLQISEITLD